MKVVDLSHSISEDMPVYPGTEKPKINNIAEVSKNGFSEKQLTLSTHTGTHVDAPAHILTGGATLDEFEGGKFVGKAVLIRVEGEKIYLEDIKKYGLLLDDADYAIIRSGWSRHWGSDRYFYSYPVLEEAAAIWLSEKNLKGIGIDAISIDPIDSVCLPNHKIFLKKEILIIENLTNLDKIEEIEFQLVCAPIKVKGSDGAPVRVFAIIP